MNLKNLLAKLSVIVVLLTVFAATSFAQVYVSNTNGNDIVGNGSQASPYKTILAGYTAATSGQTIYVDADTYGEATLLLNQAKSVTFEALAFNGLETVTITNGVTMNAANRTVTFSGSGKNFSFGATATALTLTAGTLNLSTNTTIASGATVTRTDGALVGTPTFGANINVTYNGITATTIAAGTELPASIGTGVLTVNIGGGKTISFANTLTVASTGAITITTGNATFNGALVLADVVFTNTPNGNTVTVNGNVSYTIDANTSPLVTNNGTGTLKFAGTVGFAKKSTGAAAHNTVQIRNNSTGTLTFEQGYTATSATIGGTAYLISVNMLNTGASPAKLTFNGSIASNSGTLTNSSTGTITLTGGTVGGDVDNGTGGKLVINANTTFAGHVDNSNAASEIKLNTFTLTLSGTTKNLDNTGGGKIYSSTAGAIGTGVISISGRYSTVGAAVELPNVTVTGSGGSLTLGANATLYGNFTIAGSRTAAPVAYVDAGFDLSLYGNFNRSNNTVGNVVSTGSVTFLGTAAQTFTPGASLTLNDVVINKASGKVTMASSLNVADDFTITSGQLELGDYNINMNGGVGAIFDNDGSYYSTTGVGYIVFQGVAGNITSTGGAGTFNNILINTTAGADILVLNSINISGTLVLYNGNLDINGQTVTFSTTLAQPKVRHKTDPTTALTARIIDGGAGTIAFAGTTLLDVELFGNANYNYGVNASLEWNNAYGTDLMLRNVDIFTGTGSRTVTTEAFPPTIAGTLTVNKGQTLNLAAQTATLSGNNKTHLIKGTVAAGELYVTGTPSAVNGGAASDENVINDLEIDNGAAGTFTSTGLEAVNNIVNTTGTSTITLSNAAGTAHAGDLTVNGGTLTYNLGSVASTTGIQGATGVTLANAGVLNLASKMPVTVDLSMANTSVLNLGAFDMVLDGSFTHNGTSTITATSGALVMTASAGANVTLTTPVEIPNFEIDAPGQTVTLVTDDLTVTKQFDLTDGTFDLNGLDLTVSGSVFNMDYNNAPAFDDAVNTSAIHLTGADLKVNALGGNVDFSGATNSPDVEVNTTGKVTFADGDGNGAYTFTVGEDFIQTAGQVVLGDNDLILNGDFTRVDGTWSQEDGFLIWNSATGFYTTGDAFSVDNLEIQASIADTDDKPWTVKKYLLLTGGTLTTTTAGNLNIANEATIERSLTTALLGEVPTFGTDINVIYSGAEAADITTDNELPATVKNFTLNRTTGAPANDLHLNDDLTITGKLYLQAGIFNETTGDVTLGTNATLERTAGGSFLATHVPTVTTYNLVYSGGTSFNTAAEDFMTGMASLTVKMGAAAFVSLNANRTVSGPVTINSNATGGLDLATRTLTATGDFTVTAGLVRNTGAAGSLKLAGAVAQTITVPAAGFTFPSTGAASLEINNTSTDGITLAGGNLTMNNVNAANVVKFVNGVVKTGANTLVLWHGDDGSQPLQGFTHNVATGAYSHVVGNVKKYVDATGTAAQTTSSTVALTRIEFPVGTAPTSPGYYRPMAFQFNTLPTANFNLTVSHVVSAPAGTNGFPLTSGSLTITNYPGFYWLVKSDLTLQPQVKYDIEARADGYTDYQTDGVQNIRFIRRFDTNTDNPWLVQGGSGYDNSSFDYLATPATLTDDSPVIIVRDAEGAISGQGARFTYSQLNKKPVLSTPADVVVNEMQPVAITWTANDPDINQTATFTGVTWTPAAPAGATFNTATGALSWTPSYTQSGTYTVTVSATDGVLMSTDVVTITVNNANQVPSFTATGGAVLTDATIPYGTAKTFTYIAKDADNETLTYAVNIAPVPAGTFSISNAFGSVGLFTFTPTFADNGKTFVVTVTATDPSAGVATTTANLTITGAYQRGDATLSGGAPDVNDAIKILEHVVGKITLTAEQQVYADAKIDGVIGAVDASYVLSFIANGTWPTFKSVATAGTVEFAKMSAENGVLSLPLAISATSGVTSIYAEADLNNANIEVGKVNMRLPEGWLVVTNTENGKVRIAAAGTTAINDGVFATVEVKLKDKETAVSIVGNAKLNDEISSSLNAKVREIPSEFALSQNYPNPFNPTTSIKFQVAQDAKVSLVVYNLLGQRVRTLVDGIQEAGFYTVRWDGSNDFGSKVSSGIYIYRLQAGNFVSTMKMNLMK